MINVRIPYIDKEDPTDPDTIDVAVRFRFFFDIAFYLTCTQLGTAMIGIFISHVENWFRTFMVLLFWLCNITIVLLWLYAFTVRYLHSGKECSGDFIVSRKEAKSLMYVEGMFIKFCSLLVLFIALLLVVGHVLNFI